MNKANNAVRLVDKSPSIAVKSHETRSLCKNRQIAQDKLIDKLDHYFNKDQSVEAQVNKLLKERELKNKEKAKIKREEKAKLKVEENEPRSILNAESECNENVDSNAKNNESRSVCPSIKSNDGMP